MDFKMDTCSRCGLCAEVCPNKIITKIENKMAFLDDRVQFCFHCGQCMSVCPTQSVFVDGLSYQTDFYELPQMEYPGQAFFDLISTRRAVRNFQEKEVPREMLEKIVQAISLAPPGFPPVKIELIVVKDSGLIKKALPYMVELYAYLVKVIKNPVAKSFIKKELGEKKFKQMQQHLIPLLEMRLPGLMDGSEDTITRNAPAMILFHADKNEEDIREDAMIAATYCMLAAHALGLGGSIMDIIPPAIEKKEELRKMFQVPENHEILASVILGYPKYRYRRGIIRRLKSVVWI